jgi:hypothetical protein
MSSGGRLHIVIIAWLFVTLMMALAMRSGWAGATFFLAVGLAPVALFVWLALSRVRARSLAESTLESQVKATDDGDT